MRLPASFFISLYTSACTLRDGFAPLSFFLQVFFCRRYLSLQLNVFLPVSSTVVLAGCQPAELERSRECPAVFQQFLFLIVLSVEIQAL